MSSRDIFFDKVDVTAGGNHWGKIFFLAQRCQLMVNCWFGLVVWDSRGTPK